MIAALAKLLALCAAIGSALLVIVVLGALAAPLIGSGPALLLEFVLPVALIWIWQRRSRSRIRTDLRTS